ncbi:MAG: hypothetical protein ACI4QL_03720 [Candidatus Fimimonas sp.]
MTLFAEAMTGAQIVQAIVDIIVSAIVPIGKAIGAGLSDLATALFIGEAGLTVFGTLIIVFAAISLGFALTRWVLNFVTSLGNRNR